MLRPARRILVTLLSLLLATAWPACAAPASAPAPGAKDDAAPEALTEAWGIVTSQTVTVAGHEFAGHFIAEWRDKPGSERYTLALRERPSARWGSLVWIEYGQQRVLQLQLPPARAGLKALAESAAENAYQIIIDLERQRRLVSDADLAPDEF
jgi:curli production assembly/transport component CsgE